MHPLISVEELEAALSADQRPVLLDVRWKLGGPPGRSAYLAGHIPGAHFVDLETHLADPPGGGGRHPLPDPERFAAAMRRCGVSRGRGVVAYDADDSTSAARAWWLLRHHGHRDVRVLDGGLRAWLDRGLPVTTAPPAAEDGDFAPTGGGQRVVSADEAARLARTGLLLDARAGARYRGEVEPIDPVAGHVPGSVSAPTTDNVDDAGRFLGAQMLRERFAELGADGTRAVAVYCGSGVTATHEILALQVAGIEAALYAGSWSHWVTDPDHPVAVGPEPG